MKRGVSVVICCFNSVGRLGPTLEHLARLPSSHDIPWEVIIVDNASTDDTAGYALQCWPPSPPAPLRVVREDKPGTGNARLCGLQKAQYEIVSFIDDDNWVCADWIKKVWNAMHREPRIAICGAYCEAATEKTPPAWFMQFARSYAVGGMAEKAGDITWTKGYVWTAGAALRKVAWDNLVQHGYSLGYEDKKGFALSRGEDTEMCLALRLAGWELHYDPSLHIRHFIPQGRLTWEYLRRLRRGFGMSSVVHDAYRFVSEPRWNSLKKRLKRTWSLQMVLGASHLLTAWRAARAVSFAEGEESVLEYEWALGRLTELWRWRRIYGTHITRIYSAPWRNSRQVFVAPATATGAL